MSYWEYEIKHFSAVLKLWDLVREEKTDILKRHIEWQEIPLGVRLKWEDGFWATNQKDLVERWKYGDCLEPARFYIHERINERLHGHVDSVIFPFIKSEIYMAPDCLISGLYLMLAFEISGHATEMKAPRPCKGCREKFSTTNDRKLYCSRNCEWKYTKRTQRARAKAQERKSASKPRSRR